jgi:hypothetical protein
LILLGPICILKKRQCTLKSLKHWNQNLYHLLLSQATTI